MAQSVQIPFNERKVQFLVAEGYIPLQVPTPYKSVEELIAAHQEDFSVWDKDPSKIKGARKVDVKFHDQVNMVFAKYKCNCRDHHH